MKFGFSKIVKPTGLTIEDRLVSESIDSLHKKESEVFESALRTTAEPVIKGPITRSKIKWRGIRIIKQFPYCWLEQRGKRISEKINGVLDCGIDYDTKIHN